MPRCRPRSWPAAYRATKRSLHSNAPRASIRSALWRSRWVRYPVYGVGALTFSAVTTIGGLLIYDSLTYHAVDVHESTMGDLATCEVGGPEQRPILPRTQTNEKGHLKERLVIVGGGWGAVSLLNSLDRNAYEVTLVSPNNYFLFTPLLPAVAVGTVGVGSVTESLRRILSRVQGHFVQGAALRVHEAQDLDRKTLTTTQDAAGLLEVEVLSDGWDGSLDTPHEPKESARIYVPYDKLVIAVGSVTNTRGVSGLEHAHRLKTVHDAVGLRKHLLENFEMASLPTTPAEERQRLLSVVVCGGGPTGVEVAAEVFDLIHEDIRKYFPPSLQKLASVHLLQNGEHILNTYSEAISEFAERRFQKEHLDVVTNASVEEISSGSVSYTLHNPLTGEHEKRIVPAGCTIWTVGITMSDFTRGLATTLPKQGHRHALKVDAHLRVLGTKPGTMYALGDASTIDSDMQSYIDEHFSRFDKDNDNALSLDEFAQLMQVLRRKFPIAKKQLRDLAKLFSQYDVNHDLHLDRDELVPLIMDATKHMTSCPPTAQVAAQEGKYLARKLNKYASLQRASKLPNDPMEIDEDISQPFVFHSLGNIAYLGNAAAFDLPIPGPFKTFFGGLTAMYAWRSVYLSELVSLRTRMLVLGDFIKRTLWGRDVSWQ